MKKFIQIVNQELLPYLKMESIDPHDPIVFHYIPKPWKLLGAGNYAGVLLHPEYHHIVVKVYAPGRSGWKEEVDVYQKLGTHPAYSECYHAEQPYLILKRLEGVTLYDCIHKGLRISRQVIKDIDNALDYAKQRGLFPHDVHGKNVMITNDRGVVVDVSDFNEREYCSKWDDLKKAYYRLYLPFFYRYPIPVPYLFLNGIRKSYRLYKRYFFS